VVQPARVHANGAARAGWACWALRMSLSHERHYRTAPPLEGRDQALVAGGYLAEDVGPQPARSGQILLLHGEDVPGEVRTPVEEHTTTKDDRTVIPVLLSELGVLAPDLFDVARGDDASLGELQTQVQPAPVVLDRRLQRLQRDWRGDRLSAFGCPIGQAVVHDLEVEVADCHVQDGR